MNQRNKPISVIIADDHELFRDGFCSLFAEQDPVKVVAEAANGQQLVELTAQLLPDVVITDIQMPVMDGVQATRSITKQYPQVSIIALSSFDNDRLIIDMHEAGAIGYLLKNARKKEILEAISSAARHHPAYCSNINSKLARLIATSVFDPADPSVGISLSDREKEIIRLICMEWSNKQMAEKFNLSTRTIEGYRERILEKTKTNNTVGLVVYAIKNRIFEP